MDYSELFEPGALVFLVGGLVAIVAITGYFLSDTAKRRSDNDLKSQMLEAGRSVEEIERVIEAGRTPPAERDPVDSGE